MKILLTNLPVIINGYRTCMPPLGLQYLASNIKGDHEVGIIDQVLNYDSKQEISDNGIWLYGLSKQTTEALISAFNPDVIGVSCNYSYQHGLLMQMLKIIKDLNPKIRTVIGGNHVTAYYKKGFPPFENCDGYILGEGEEALNLFLEGKLEKNKFYQVKDLDSLKFPARGDLEPYYKQNLQHHRINIEGNRVVVMITGRGCYRDCIYCSVRNIWGKGVRMRSPENVLLEIDEIVNKHKATEIHFEDDNLLFHKKRCLEIFKGMEKYKIRWTCPNGVDLSRIDEEILESMWDSGCRRITICPESVTDRILKFYRKPFDFKMIQEKVKLIRRYRFELVGYFIIGAPDETLQEMWNTLKFGINEFDDFSLSNLAPYLGTDLYNYCEMNDLFYEPPEKFHFLKMQADVVEGFKRLASSNDMINIGSMMNFFKKAKVKV